MGFIVLFVSCQNTQQSNNSSTIYENSDQLVEAAKKVITEIPVSEFKTIYDGEDYYFKRQCLQESYYRYNIGDKTDLRRALIK